jgi:hypothetical protein
MQWQGWEMLLTTAGATAVTTTLTAIAKKLFPISGKQVLWFAIGTGVVIVTLAFAFTGHTSAAALSMAVLNGIFVGWGASGLNDTVNK